MKDKLLYTTILVLLSLGFFLVGSLTHQHTPVSIVYNAPDGPNFTEATPYLHTVYGSEDGYCPPTNTSDDYVCIYKLAHSTLDKADALAQKLMNASPATSTDEYIQDLRANVLSAQKARDGYFDAICNLDEMVIYGGSGMDLEREACRHYYAEQYLKVLQKLESIK